MDRSKQEEGAVVLRSEVVSALERDGVVAVFSHADLDTAKQLARSVAGAGLTTLEFTNRDAGAIAVAIDLIAWARSELPEFLIGVGTVTDPATASRVIDSGAKFVFSPSFSADVALVCHRSGVLYVPGCGTVTEIQTAYEAGCELVKLFPAGSLGGPSFLAAVRAPCPWVQAIPTGGVEPTADSLRSWYEAGAPAVGMGSKLFPSDRLKARDWEFVEGTLAGAVGAAAAARGRG